MVVGNAEKLLYAMKEKDVLAGIETRNIVEYKEMTDLREWHKIKAFDFLDRLLQFLKGCRI